MLPLLLAKTSLEIKMKDVTPSPFISNIGSPQGDGISGILFNIYFENSLKTVRSKLDQYDDHVWTEHCYAKKSTSQIPFSEIIYADDFDHITDDVKEKKRFDKIIKETLAVDNLLVNEDKTEHTLIKRITNKNEGDETWRHVKKLGSTC